MGESVWMLMATGGRMETRGRKTNAHNASARYSSVSYVTFPVFCFLSGVVKITLFVDIQKKSFIFNIMCGGGEGGVAVLTV